MVVPIASIRVRNVVKYDPKQINSLWYYTAAAAHGVAWLDIVCLAHVCLCLAIPFGLTMFHVHCAWTSYNISH